MPRRIHCRFWKPPEGAFPSDPYTYSSHTTSAQTKTCPATHRQSMWAKWCPTCPGKTIEVSLQRQTRCLTNRVHQRQCQRSLEHSRCLQSLWAQQTPKEPKSQTAQPCQDTWQSQEHTRAHKTWQADHGTKSSHHDSAARAAPPALVMLMPSLSTDLSICTAQWPMEKQRKGGTG